MMNSRIAEIAVEKAAYSFDKAFDYVIPDSMLDKAVAVPGRVQGRPGGADRH